MRDPNCTKCPLHLSSTNVCIWGDGPETADIMVIGEAPGEKESETGRPFMGKSGQLLREELASHGILDRVYITNVAKCRPPDNRTPTPEEIKTCSPYLKEEIEKIKPKFIVTLGNAATKSVLKKSKITQCHGQIVEGDGWTGMPIYHPAYTLYDVSKLPAFKADIAKLADLVKGVSRKREVNWSIVTRDNLDQFIEEFKTADGFAYDVETGGDYERSGLFPYDRQGWVKCLGIGLENRSWIIPLNVPDSTFFNSRLQRDIIQVVVELAQGKTAIAQNGKFDDQWLDIYYDCRFHLDFDTMLAHHLLDENNRHDLEGIVRQELQEPDYTPEEKKYFTLSKCAKDVAYTLRLKKILDRRLRQDPALRKLFYKLVMPAARAFVDIEMRGLCIDVEQMKVVEKETIKRAEGLLKKLNRLVKREVNWNSPQQVAQVLFGDLKLQPVAFTSKGAASTGEATLVELRHKHPVANLLVEYREASKFLSTYIEGWREHMYGDFLYLGYKIHGTVTGRYSSRLHQTPRDERIRSLITNRGEWPFVQIDISQAEMRIACILSGDLELRRCFTEGIDVHWRTLLHTVQSGGSGEYVEPVLDTAKKLCGHSVSLNEGIQILLKAGPSKCQKIWSGWKEARKKAKGINFGFLFGMYEKKFIDYCKMKYDFEPTMLQSKRYRRAFFDLYYSLEKWHTKQKKLTRLNGQVRNLAGRIRRLPEVYSTDWYLRSEAERQGINSPVQGFVGDFKAMGAVEIAETVPDNRFFLVGEHHDAILGYVHPHNNQDTLAKVAAIMRKPKLLDQLGIELSIPMEVEVAVGPWGRGVTIDV